MDNIHRIHGHRTGWLVLLDIVKYFVLNAPHSPNTYVLLCKKGLINLYMVLIQTLTVAPDNL